jgi:hypothetical protein
MTHESEMIRTASSVGKGNKSVPRGKIGGFFGEYPSCFSPSCYAKASLISDRRISQPLLVGLNCVCYKKNLKSKD